jgi:chemotaxis protein methyltransferase CheR
MRAPIDVESIEIDLILEGIFQRYGFDLRQYAPASLRRRIRWHLTKEELPSVSALQERLLHDRDAFERFVAGLSVNVTAMFRDPGFYQTLRERVLPMLRTYPFIRVWVAGCSSGEEVYSLAILLEEAELYDRSLIYATDMSLDVLERAKRGLFPLDKMREHTENYALAGGTREFSSYYVSDHEGAMFRKALKRNVVFSQHNLVSDGSFNEFHLILCRNVMIYFNRELREKVLELLDVSLCVFGVLGLGIRESLEFTTFARRYEELSPGTRLYRRVR